MTMVRAERYSEGNSTGPDGKKGDGPSEQFLIEQWENAPIDVITPGKGYVAGTVQLTDGTSYDYLEGRRLLVTIKGRKKQVMDTCEYPWAAATINKAFDEMKTLEEHPTIHVAEFGFGLGITANRVLEQIDGRGLKGKYVGVELNKQVNEEIALPWRDRKFAEFDRKEQEQPGSRPDIEIELVQGEAGQVATQLLNEVNAGVRPKFNIVISDTYPIKQEQEGINDLLYLSVMKDLLAPGGVFAFYPYSAGWTPKPAFEKQVTSKQKGLIEPYFGDVVTDLSPEVSPPPEYTYLFRKSGPIRQLPIAVCRFPKLAKAA